MDISVPENHGREAALEHSFRDASGSKLPQSKALGASLASHRAQLERPNSGAMASFQLQMAYFEAVTASWGCRWVTFEAATASFELPMAHVGTVTASPWPFVKPEEPFIKSADSSMRHRGPLRS